MAAPVGAKLVRTFLKKKRLTIRVWQGIIGILPMFDDNPRGLQTLITPLSAWRFGLVLRQSTKG